MEEKKKKKKEKKVAKDEGASEEAGDAVVSSREGPSDVVEGGIGLISMSNDEKKRRKKKEEKRRDVQVTEGNEEVSGEVEEGINTAEMGDEIEEKAGKKKRKDQGKTDKAARLEEHNVRHAGMGSCLKGNNMKRKNREWSSRETKSFSEQCTAEEEANQQRSFCKDEKIAGESGSDGSHHFKRRKKKLVEGNSLWSGENEKRKKDKDKLVEHVKPILNDTSDWGFDAVDDEPTRTAEEAGGDGNHRTQCSSVSRDERKARNKNKKKKNKNGIAESVKFSVEVNSDEEISGKANQAVEAEKISNISAGEGTSIVRNIDNARASTATGTKKKVKQVSFSGNVEVIPSTNWIKRDHQSSRDGLVQGKRYSREEDEMIKQAVFDYIKENQLGDDGLNMVLNCRSHRETKNCWKEIGAALPWRPKQSIYCRAHNLFQRSEARKWEPEELDLVLSYHDEHGPKWKALGALLGKHRVHVKDAWRRNKLTSANKGKWTQEEYQSLFDLVNADLQLQAFEEKKTKHGMLRENISWGAISNRLATRAEVPYCIKWYRQLASPMVSQGLWADADDYHLIDGLLKLDACCIEDVGWDNLLEDRSGEICLKRWKQMARHIGGHREKSFMEQVELLATRYCPNMLPYRIRDFKESDEDNNETESSD